MPVSHLDLRRIQHRLDQEYALARADLRALEKEKAEYFQRGIQSDSTFTQRSLARVIAGLEQRARAIDRTLKIIEQQLRLLAHLRLAQEMRDRLEDSLFNQVDWEDLLAAVRAAAGIQPGWGRRLGSTIKLFETPAVSASAAPPRPKRPPKPQPAGEIVRAASIPDGDGLKLEDGRRVRYIGIDAPEMKTWQGESEPCAAQAREFNRRLVQGKALRLVSDQRNTDRYGRLLRYVYAGETLVNAELLRAGLARVLPIPPNLAHASAFQSLEESARRARLGIWKED